MAFASATFNGMTPLRIYNPVIDWKSSTTNLWIASFWELFLLFFGVMQNQLVDVFMVLYSSMLRAHLGVLRERVCKLRLDTEETEEKRYENLKICLAHHKLILEYVEIMRPLVSRTTFIQFLLIGAILGCTLVNLFFFSDFWAGLACVAYVIGIICQTFPFCYTCDLIMDDCDRLALAIFHSNWYNSSRRYKSTLIQFLHKAQQPIAFSAGSIFSICMQTNIKVAKLAFSVVTFVKQMNIEEKLRKN
ncbi:odorant receptor 42b-like [Drosophila tropicalis]|uniref:odorant receptor 42b-like n=1 Tax=Drosophila tropicalis TaxID=46794 RepID=UPI0035ABDDCF